jgi:hypothetical protein
MRGVGALVFGVGNSVHVCVGRAPVFVDGFSQFRIGAMIYFVRDSITVKIERTSVKVY